MSSDRPQHRSERTSPTSPEMADAPKGQPMLRGGHVSRPVKYRMDKLTRVVENGAAKIDEPV
jgi:hypothetical protein